MTTLYNRFARSQPLTRCGFICVPIIMMCSIKPSRTIALTFSGALAAPAAGVTARAQLAYFAREWCGRKAMELGNRLHRDVNNDEQALILA